MNKRWWIAAGLCLVGAVALADGPVRDARGWLPGQVAANTELVVTGLTPDQMPTIEVPKLLGTEIKQPTVVFYFSPTCPHCVAVAAEVNQLSQRVEESGAVLIGVSSGSATLEQLEAFKREHNIRFNILHDADREIVAALGARSTPSAVLVHPESKTKVKVVDVWYPYMPGFDGLVEARIKGDAFSVFREDEYQGNNHCGSCHVTEHLSWGLTHHSIAWRILALQDKMDDPKCTSCHVTGAGQPTGWDGSPQHALTDVGCEACHGPGGPHDGKRLDPKASCEGCHDADHSIAFSVEKGLPLIDHFRADSLDDAAFQAVRKDLYNGDIPRALLAFDEGVNVGPDACQSCHPAQHAQWSLSAHSGAMSKLKADDKDQDASCVRCHATAKKSGPAPSSLEAFHIEGGVSCESCHGPGEAHVKAGGGTENIEGLGEDCPVCVIEAVCTGCHTSEWDPTWNLDDKLPKAGHGSRKPGTE